MPVAVLQVAPAPDRWTTVELGPLCLRLPLGENCSISELSFTPGVVIRSATNTFMIFVPKLEAGHDHLSRLRVPGLRAPWTENEVAFRAFLYGADEEMLAKAAEPWGQQLVSLRRLIVASVDRVETHEGDGLRGLCLYVEKKQWTSVSFEYYSLDERWNGLLDVEIDKKVSSDIIPRVIGSCRFQPTSAAMQSMSDPRRLAHDLVDRLRQRCSTHPESSPANQALGK